MDEVVVQTLQDGLDRLRERGLAKLTFCDRDGRVCARGALIGAEGSWVGDTGLWFTHPEDGPVRRADRLLSEVASEQYQDRIRGVGREPVVAFNNHPDTTQDDVERVFEKAIARAQED